jgi:hypothetical protein
VIDLSSDSRRRTMVSSEPARRQRFRAMRRSGDYSVTVIATIIAMLNANNPSSSADSPRRAWVKSVIGMENPSLWRLRFLANRPRSNRFRLQENYSVHHRA